MKKISLYNTLTKKIESYNNLGRETINIYSCGPTVYDNSHIGHARSAITWDFIVRFLRFLDYNVSWTRNITDVDDKIINRAKELNIRPNELARIFTLSFHKDMLELNVDEPNHEPKATEYIKCMQDFIKELIEKGHGYIIENDVYYSATTYKKYGHLKGQTIQELEKGFSRIEPNPKKKHPLDFALWKGIKEKDEFGYESIWGKGRPGWHIECSSMCRYLYEDNLDIHCGGDDLIFPHHENEIAQSESIIKNFARYWLHNGMIMINGKKMAKSEGNYITIKEALKEYSGNAIRFFMLSSHYRMPINYTTEALRGAENAVNRLIQSIEDYNPSIKNNNLKTNKNYIEEFTGVMNDDFNSPKALSILFNIVDKINIEKSRDMKSEYQNTLVYLSNVLGFNIYQTNNIGLQDDILTKIINKLISWRAECKSQKDFKNADKIRDILSENNIEIKDISNSQFKWKIRR